MTAPWCSPRDTQIPNTAYPTTFRNLCPGSRSCQAQSRNGAGNPVLENTDTPSPAPSIPLALFSALWLTFLRTLKLTKRSHLEDPAHSLRCHCCHACLCPCSVWQPRPGARAPALPCCIGVPHCSCYLSQLACTGHLLAANHSLAYEFFTATLCR